MASAGRLRARASNCRLPIRFMFAPSSAACLRVRSVSCVAYPRDGIRRFRCSHPPCALRGAGWTRGGLRVPGVPRASLRGRPGPRSPCPFSRMRNVTRGRGASASLRPSFTYVPRCERLPRPPRSRPAGRAGVGVGEECYLVDPASSHMLVSKIKPCMCKYELIQTVKLRMAH